MTYAFFINKEKEEVENDLETVYAPPDPNPPAHEMLLKVLSCVDHRFKANVFMKIEPTLVNADEVLAAATSPLPSVLLTGKLKFIFLECA